MTKGYSKYALRPIYLDWYRTDCVYSGAQKQQISVEKTVSVTRN